MPENLDPSSVTSNPTPEPTPDAVVTDEATPTPEPAERHVPLADLVDERHARQAAQANATAAQNQVILLQQQLMELKAQVAPKGAPVDPQIQELLQPYIGPLQEELKAAKAAASAAQAQADVQQKMDFIRQNLPNFDALGPEIAKEIQKMDPSEQEIFLANPRAIIRLGKMIEKDMASAKAASTKAVARAAGKTETGAGSAAASSDAVSAETDWMNMSAEDFNNDPRVKAMFG